MLNYITKYINSQNYSRFEQILLFLFYLSLFFPIRHIFFTKEAYFTGIYSDFTSFSLYLSDILILLLAMGVLLPRGGEFYHVVGKFWGLFIWLILGFILHFGLNIRFSAFLLIKWIEIIVAYGTLTILLKNMSKIWILKLFTYFATIQSLLVAAQFALQHSLGLYRLGESIIGPNILGVAKIVSSGTVFIRGYGTFPHPNALSAFLAAGALIGLYLLYFSNTNREKTVNISLLLINLLGLVLTFSRGAYLALGFGTLFLFGYFFWFGSKKLLILPAITFGLGLVTCLLLFQPFLISRATFSDQSTIARKFYDIQGIKMAIKTPWFGVGAGESLLHMEQISGISLKPWDKQPPHNYFIIAAAELGVAAMLMLVWIFWWHLNLMYQKIKTDFKNFAFTSYYLLLTLLLLMFLLLMQFDHYFYTLEQTQLLLWSLLALIAAQQKTPPNLGEAT